MTDTKPFGLGFIGCGSYCRSLAEAGKKTRKLTFAGCYDVSEENAESFSNQFGAPRYASLESLLASPDVEGVVIVSPNDAHRPNAEAAAAAGKHIYIDKPIANTIPDALAIIRAAENAGLVLAIGHQGRRMPGHRKMKQMIDSGDIGTPVTVESNFSHSGGLGLTPNQWRFYRDKCPGLPLMQLGVHFADTVQYLLGDVLEVSSFMSHIATPADNDDVTVSILRFANGLLGYLGSNYATPSIYYVNVYGTEGNLHCEGGGQLFYRRTNSTEKEPVRLTGVDAQLEELVEFAECARLNNSFEVDGQAGLKALAVVRAAVESHQTGKPVVIADLIAEAEALI